MVKPILVIAIGLVYWLTYVIKAWAACGDVNNALLVSSYTQTAILGMWIMFFGGLWLYFQKR